MPVKRHSIAHSEENARARTFEFFYRGRVSLRAGKHPFGLFKGQRSSQGLVVVAGTVVDVLNGWFAFVVAVRKLVVIPPIRVKDRFDDSALQPPSPGLGSAAALPVSRCLFMMA